MTPKPRFSGHETFPCRYAWLPKAVRVIGDDAARFADDKQAMVDLGLGKNMVRATRFWVHVSGMADVKDGKYSVTDLGKRILGDRGHDPYLEDIRTLWLIHWKLSTHVDEPLFAWDFLLNRWSHPELTKSSALKAFRNESNRLERDRELSDVTLEQHFETFLHTYVPTRSRKGEIQEDNLDCPLVELRLIEAIGERRADESTRHETVYTFRREPKPEICSHLFLYAIEDYWSSRRRNEQTLTFRDLAVAPGSPGQIFKLPESDVRERLESVEGDTNGAYVYRESTTTQQLLRKGEIAPKELLKQIYGKERN
jgi:hypothetical protein